MCPLIEGDRVMCHLHCERGCCGYLDQTNRPELGFFPGRMENKIQVYPCVYLVSRTACERPHPAVGGAAHTVFILGSCGLS